MREEDDVERSGGRDREKSSRYTGCEGREGGEGEKRQRSATLEVRVERGRSARARRERERTKREEDEEGQIEGEKRGEMGYAAVERG